MNFLLFDEDRIGLLHQEVILFRFKVEKKSFEICVCIKITTICFRIRSFLYMGKLLFRSNIGLKRLIEVEIII